MEYPVRGKPLTHQTRALNESGLKAGHAYFMDPGAGKTFTAIAEAGLLYLRDKIDGVLITAPNGPHLQWVDEQFPEWAAYPWHGLHNRMTPKVMKDALFAGTTLDACGVATINHDALRTPKGKEFIRKFREVYPRLYFVDDESQKMKDPKAARTCEAMAIAKKATASRILTGTPILKGLEDLWTQYEIACPGRNITGFTSHWTYKNYYCLLEPVYGRNVDPRAKKVVGYRNEEELMQRTRPYVSRVMSDEFMVGEKPSFMTVSCPMETRQAKAYMQMKELLLTQIDGEMITAKNALVALQKLQQLASGFIYHDEEFEPVDGEDERPDSDMEVKPYEMLGRNKINAVADLLENLDEPVLIWAPYRALQQQLMIEVNDMIERRKIGDRALYLYDGRDSILSWQKRPNGVMIANQAGGCGVGQNLQVCAANIYVANTFAAEARWQSLKRTDRIGQKRQVRVWDLVAPGTTDRKALKSLMEKEDISRKNIDGLRDLIV